MRLDLFILQKFNLKSRSFAENLIKKGKVNVNNVTQKKPSFDVSDDDDVEVFQNDEFESLGGDKLQKAIVEFNIDVENLECVDIGASNGGFTDCMLKHGAKVVYAVDRMKVVNDILNFARELGFSAEGITTVPDNFKNKNVEYLLYFKKTAFVSRPVKSVDLSFIKNL